MLRESVCDYCRNICKELLHMLRPDRNDGKTNGPHKVLNAPVHLGSMAANLESNVDDIKSIWVIQRDDNLVSFFFFWLCWFCFVYAILLYIESGC